MTKILEQHRDQLELVTELLDKKHSMLKASTT
jgi:hypothetical protein